MLKLIRSKIQIKLILIFFVAFGLALTASTIVLLLSINKLGILSIQRQLDEEKMIIAQQLGNIELELLQTAKLVSRQPHIIETIIMNGLNETGFESSLEITATSLNHDMLWIVDTNGDIIEHYSIMDGSVKPDADINALLVDLLPLQSSPSSGMYVIDEAYVMLASLPIYTSNQTIVGFVVAGNVIDSQMLGKINFYRDNLALVMYPDTATIEGISASEVNNLPHLLPDEVEALRLNGSMLDRVQDGDFIRIYDVIVRETLHAVAYLPFEINDQYHGYYAIAIDEGELRTIQLTILIVSLSTIFILLFLVSFLVVLSIWHVVLNPLRILNEVAYQFGNGNTDIRIMPIRYDEIGKLFTTFNTMATRINQRTKELNTLNALLETRVRERTAQAEQQTVWLETIVYQAKEAIVVTRADGNITLINAMALSIMNIKEPAICGKSLVELMQNVAGCDILLPLRNAEVQGELKIADHFYQYSIAAIQTGVLNTISGYVCVLTDVTTLRRLNALQSQVIRIAAHDLRSPITALGLQFQILQRISEPLSTKQSDVLNRMKTTVSNMYDMINGLLNVERIEQQVSGMSETVVLESLISSALTVLETQFVQKQQTVSVEAESNLPLFYGDPVRLLEVLQNLLSNAHKYTPYRGEIILRAYVGKNGLHVDVSDSGIGIDEDDIQHIFEERFRAQTALNSGIEGLGVGLSLVKEIIHEHGGEISVTSHKGTGSTFSFYLPLP